MPKRKQASTHHPELGLPEVRPLWEKGGLLSDHYLRTRLRQNAWWPSDDQARPHWAFCRELYNRRYLALAKYGNEASLRQELIDKVLKQLGFDWIDNLSLPDQDAEPDYLLFASSADKEAVLEKSATDRYRGAVAILEAKKLHHPLSQLSKHQVRYPHQQIRDYLLDAQVLGWGILTNGNVWRLYCRDAKRHEYFEINFEVAIQSLDAFKCFLALFGPDAFRRGADGRCRLDDIRDQAVSVQTELEENLRQRVFTILADLANGFASRTENNVEEHGLGVLYQNCLIYLYRLLFVLYAEGRDLLPVNRPDRKYMKNLSLARLRRGLQDFSEHDDRHLTRLCESLRDLFRLINGANERMNRDYAVPRYNGGLFDPEKYPLLERWAVADADLAAVLRGLMFSPPPERDKPALPIQTVDFADLRVQHLGSIYEGLLEHHLVRGGDGRLRLDVDRAERKATGTYYTPDYIVKHIVENTVGPLLKQIEDSDAVKAAVAGQQRNDAFAEQALELNILDPAMGSGHFLVEAVTFLADHIVHHPTTRYLDAEKRGEPKAEQEIAHWRRRVVEACIYGVDLNPLAVELAKLSLWLVTIATDKPLNFLDHHLRCGNSLIGARLDRLGGPPVRKTRMVREKPEQQLLISGAGFRRAVADVISGIHAIESQDSDKREDVKNKEERWHKEIEPRLRPFSAVADLWTSAFFGREIDEGQYAAEAQRLFAGRTIPFPEAETRHFFHWELVFPEVFFNEDGSPKENPGFDAVIGNPPYVRPHKLCSDVKEFLWSDYASYVAKSDLLNCFLEKGLRLAGEGKFVGMITSDTWRILKSAETLRAMILAMSCVREVRILSSGVFHDAAVTPVVVVLQKVQDRNRRLANSAGTSIAKLDGPTMQCRQQVWMDDPHHTFDILGEATLDVKRSIEQRAEPLESLCTIDFGLKTGDDARFLRFEPGTRDDKKIVTSAQIGRYTVDWRGMYVWYRPDLMREHRQTARPGEALRFERDKILLSRMAERIEAAMDREGLYVKDAYLLAVPRIGYRLEYLLALLNSRAVNFWYLSTFTSVDVHLNEIARLPIRRIEFTTSEAERKRHGKKAQQAYEQGLRASNATPVLSLVDEDMKASRTDVIHDFLAFLAERMTAMNEEKHETAKGFLTNLKDFHGVDAHSLKPKTRLDEFWTLEVADVFAHFKANVRTLAAQGVRLQESDEGKIRSRFQKAKDKVVPLEAALALTDRLIDRIVYRLYDLTPEEIRIVEGLREA